MNNKKQPSVIMRLIQGALILIAVVSNVLMQRAMIKQNLRRRNI